MDLGFYQAEKILTFLEKIHPEKKDFYEIRTIDRVEKNKYGKPLSLCFHISGGNSSYNNTISLNNILNRILFNKKNCLYYSVYSYSPQSKYERINSTNSLYTNIVIADFDHIEEKDFKPILDKFYSVGIEPIVIQSGHGFQVVILLSETSYNKNLQKEFLSLFLQKGFPVDCAVGLSSGQIMRLPYTYNCKDTKNIVKTTIYADSNSRYSIDELKSKIGTLPDDSIFEKTLEKINSKSVEKSYKSEKIKKSKAVDIILADKKTLIAKESVYRNLLGNEKYEKIPIGIKNMLRYTQKGYRNTALFAIVNYFVSIEKLDTETLKKIISEWCLHTNPQLDLTEALSETDRLMKYKYPALHKIRNYEIDRKFGRITLPKEQETEKIRISDKIFANYDKVHAFAVRLYFAICLWTKRQIKISAEDIEANFGVSRATVYRAIRVLKEFDLLRKKSCGYKNKREKEYYSAKYRPLKTGKYITFEEAKLENMVFGDMTDGEIKVYMGLRSLDNKKESETLTFGQTRLGKIMGYSRGYISRITSALNRRKIIVKTTVTEFFSKLEEGLSKTRIVNRALNFIQKKGYVLSFCTYQVLRI